MSAARPRWAAPETLHVTLRFFGPTTDEQLDTLRELVTTLGENAPAIPVRAQALTGFPDASRARILVVELADAPLLTAFATRAEATARALGFAPENRAYRPHLTLARMKGVADVRALAGETAGLRMGHATAITLYASATTPTGPVYTPLARALLPAP